MFLITPALHIWFQKRPKKAVTTQDIYYRPNGILTCIPKGSPCEITTSINTELAYVWCTGLPITQLYKDEFELLPDQLNCDLIIFD